MTIDSLTYESIVARRDESRDVQRLSFEVTALYGLSRHSVAMPLNETETLKSGQVCITIDPEAEASSNHGMIDFAEGRIVVRYGIQAVFPGLYELVHDSRFDPSLFNPVRAIATDECTMTEDRSGFHAQGCLEFLPGSLWAGAEGG